MPHLKASTITGIAAALVLAQSQMARADQQTFMPTFPGSPAHITSCTFTPFEYQDRFGVIFVTDQDVPLKAVKIRFDFGDTFDVLKTIEVEENGTFSKGASIKDVWTIGALRMPSYTLISKITCYLEKTLDASDANWTNTHLPAPAASPTPES